MRGDPSQNSKKADTAMNLCAAKLLKIPAGSPDVNPIENVFNLVKEKVKQDTIDLKIKKETFTEFQRSINTQCVILAS